MTLATTVTEKWTCDNCGKVVEKVNEDMLRRHWPPEGWEPVDISINERARSTGRHACSDACFRSLVDRVISQLREAEKAGL